MRCLLLHCKDYRITIGLLANRPKDIRPEAVTYSKQELKNCILVLVTVEVGDTSKSADLLAQDVATMAHNVGRTSIAILPFAHLSNNLAKTEDALTVLDSIENELSQDFHVLRGHFGSHKEFMFDLFGHPGNARFREY